MVEGPMPHDDRACHRRAGNSPDHSDVVSQLQAGSGRLVRNAARCVVARDGVEPSTLRFQVSGPLVRSVREWPRALGRGRVQPDCDALNEDELSPQLSTPMGLPVSTRPAAGAWGDATEVPAGRTSAGSRHPTRRLGQMIQVDDQLPESWLALFRSL